MRAFYTSHCSGVKTSFPYATINVIPSHTRVDEKPFHGDDKPKKRRRLLCASNSQSQSKARACGYMIRPHTLVRSGEPVMTTKITLEPPFDFSRNITITSKITRYMVSQRLDFKLNVHSAVKVKGLLSPT